MFLTLLLAYICLIIWLLHIKSFLFSISVMNSKNSCLAQSNACWKFWNQSFLVHIEFHKEILTPSQFLIKTYKHIIAKYWWKWSYNFFRYVSRSQHLSDRFSTLWFLKCQSQHHLSVKIMIKSETDNKKNHRLKETFDLNSFFSIMVNKNK